MRGGSAHSCRPAPSYARSTRLVVGERRARDARACVALVAARVLEEVLLVVVLRVPEARGGVPVGCGRNVGLDRAESPFGEHLLVGRSQSRRVVQLALSGRPDRRAVLVADVVALAAHLRGIVDLKEEPNQVSSAGERGIEDDAHGLRVTRRVRTHLLVRRVGRMPAHVARRRGDDAGRIPQGLLDAPETPSGQVDDLLACPGLGPHVRTKDRVRCGMNIRLREREDISHI